MMGEAKPTWTKNRHEFLQLVNAAGKAGCRARGAAFGAACTAFRQLGWVEQVPAIGIKVRITELGTRALEAWDAGKRGDLDLRTGEERRQQILEDVMDLAEQHDLDALVLRALLQRMPVLEVQRCIRGAVQAASSAVATCKPMAPAELQEILATFDRMGGSSGQILPAGDDDDGMVVLDEHGRVVEVVEAGAAPKYHQGGVASLTKAGAAVLERGVEVLAKDDPRVVAAEANRPPAGSASQTVTIVVDPQPPAESSGHRGVLKALASAKSFVPGGYTGEKPSGPAARLTPAVVADPPAAAEAEDDEDDHGLVICPSCDGRGITGPLHLDCRMCKGEGAIKRTVVL